MDTRSNESEYGASVSADMNFTAAENTSPAQGEAAHTDSPAQGEAGGKVERLKAFIKEKSPLTRKKNAIDNRSFLALLIRSFVSFTAIVATLVVATMFMANWASQSDKLNLSMRTIENYQSELKSGAYDQIPTDRVFGSDGWLDIVGADGTVVYSSSSGRTYTRKELTCIIDYGRDAHVTAQQFKGSADAQQYLVSFAGADGATEYLLLERNPADADVYNIIRSSRSEFATMGTLSEREFELLTHNDAQSPDILAKYAFTGADSKNYYAVFLDSASGDRITPIIFIAIAALGLFIVLVGSLILYIRYINKHIQRPILALGNAMNHVATEGYRDGAKVEYQGSKDFEQLVTSFNEMVTLLSASDAQRVALEQEKQRMLAGLSHDLKTPMTVIQGFSKAIRDGVVSEEDVPKYLDIIIDKAEHTSELINEFYEYSKLEHPDFIFNKQDVDVAELARSYLAGRYDEFGIRGYTLDVDITEEKLVCKVDNAQLVRVFENLINNFFKYTPVGSTLYFGVKKDAANALILIADNGGGIPEASRADIFAPFVVSDESRKNQGSGLGLAVCKRIVDAHGGTIVLNNAPMEGYNTQFDILIPLRPAIAIS